jgi:hypothetical protein
MRIAARKGRGDMVQVEVRIEFDKSLHLEFNIMSREDANEGEIKLAYKIQDIFQKATRKAARLAGMEEHVTYIGDPKRE